ncbi:MAG: 2-phospho-L-lactate transferase [Euryarchaeota archaeon]
MEPRVGVLSGGTGTPKLLRGLRALEADFFVIVNTGEDRELLGLHISPDVDTVLYTLAGIVNDETWYGVDGDSFRGHEFLRERLGVDESLRIGDVDRAFKQYRTYLMKCKGMRLSEAVDELRRRLGIRWKVYPMTDDRVVTIIVTDEGEMHFHEFWVERRGQPAVDDVRYDGSEEASAPSEAVDDLLRSDVVLIGPSNPVTSIGPILSISDLRHAIREKPVVIVSPFIGNEPVSGPAGKLMRAVGFEPNVRGLVDYYRGWGIDPDVLIMDERDDVEPPGDVEVVRTDTIMKKEEDSIRLAKEVMSVLREVSRA